MVRAQVLVRACDWHRNNDKGGDRAVTNGAGEVALPAIEGSPLLGSLLPHEPARPRRESHGDGRGAAARRLERLCVEYTVRYR
jgi:hypothetical protein